MFFLTPVVLLWVFGGSFLGALIVGIWPGALLSMIWLSVGTSTRS